MSACRTTFAVWSHAAWSDLRFEPRRRAAGPLHLVELPAHSCRKRDRRLGLELSGLFSRKGWTDRAKVFADSRRRGARRDLLGRVLRLKRRRRADRRQTPIILCEWR